MTAPPAAVPTNDREHLKVLAIFHYVSGGLLAALALFNIVELFRMQSSWAGFEATVRSRGFETFEGFSLSPWMFVYPGLLAVIAVCLLTSARLLQRRHGYRFIYIVACLECVGFPFGTVLGVFTIIVLLRPSVKQLFGGNVKL